MIMAKHIKIGAPVNAAERWAFKYLKENLPDDYTLLTNVDLYDDRGRPFEIDAIVIGNWAVYLIDVKGYQGRLVASKDIWLFDEKPVENPLGKINHNSRVLASRCRKYLQRGQHSPWCQGMVFVTGGEGGDLVIDKNGYDELPVYAPTEIVRALTKPDYLTSQYRHSLEKYQKDLALNSLCDFKLIQSKNNVLAGYSKEKLVSSENGIETWIVRPVSGSFDYKYWMKFVDLTGHSENEIEFYRKILKKEYRFLNELSDIKCIPAPLTFWDDGESLALVHAFAPGEKIVNICLTDTVLSEVIFNLVDSVVKIHSKGLSCSGLTEENLYVSSEGVVTIVNIVDLVRTLKGDNLERDAQAFANVFRPHLFEPSGNGEFERNQACAEIYGIFPWFEDILFNSNSPSLDSLLDILEKKSRTDIVDIFLPEKGAILNSKYEFLSCLGRGSSSAVWKARHLIGEYVCSIKLFDEFEGADTLARQEFEILRTSFHPNIIRIFDLDKVPGTAAYYLTAQYLDGNSLDQLEYSYKELWAWFKEMLSAIQYLHRINIIHKDIKPQNIVIDSGKAYLIDFNLSSFDTPAIGTIKYKDPSVFENGWSGFSDVYSLVVTFLELYLGRMALS